MSKGKQPKDPSIDAAMLERSFDERTAGRGAKYAREGRVTGCAFDGRSLHGMVLGGAPEPYRVQARVEDGEVRSTCNCPVRGNCKHGYAMCVHWMKHREDCLDLGELKKAWARMERDDLIEVLLRAVEGRPDILDKVAGESMMRAGGPGWDKIMLGRVRKSLEDCLDTREASQAADEVKEVLSSVRERRGDISDLKAAELVLSIYAEVVNAADRVEDEDGALDEQAGKAADLFMELGRALDPPSRDRFRDRAVELFFRAGEERGGYQVLLAAVTSANAGTMVEEIDRRVAGAAGRRGPSYYVATEEAQRAAAEVLAAAGKVEEAVSRLITSDYIGDVFRAVGLLMEAGQEGRAAELMMAFRPGDSQERWAWETLVLRNLRELRERGKLHLVGGEAVEAVARSVLRHCGPGSGGGAVATAKELLEASGGPGSFERAILSIRDRRERAWAFISAGDAVRAREVYAAFRNGDRHMAWAIAEAAERGGLEDLRNEMTAEALALGGTDEMFKPRLWPRTEKALEGLDRERLAAFAEKDGVPAGRRAEVMRLLVKKDPELAGTYLERLAHRLSRDALFGLLSELGAADHDLVVNGFRAWAAERLSNTRHYAEVVDGLKDLKAITGKEGEEWSTLVRSVLEGYGDRKRLWELVDAEGWVGTAKRSPG